MERKTSNNSLQSDYFTGKFFRVVKMKMYYNVPQINRFNLRKK